MFAFFATTLGRITTIAILIAALAGIGLFLYKDHDRLVRAEALAQYNKTQLEQSLKDSQQLNQQLEDLQKRSGELTQQLNEANDKLDDQSGKVEGIIAGHQKDDRPSSDVIKDTIKELLK